MEEILTMVISALVGSVSVWAARDIIIPIAGGLLSSAPKLHKNWEFKDSKDGDVVGTAEISRLGSNVTFNAVRTVGRDGNPGDRKFIYKGKITGRTIVLHFKQKNTGGSVSGAIVLRLSSNLNSMSGSTSYFSDSAGSVINKPVFYNAKP